MDAGESVSRPCPKGEAACFLPACRDRLYALAGTLVSARCENKAGRPFLSILQAILTPMHTLKH